MISHRQTPEEKQRGTQALPACLSYAKPTTFFPKSAPISSLSSPLLFAPLLFYRQFTNSLNKFFLISILFRGLLGAAQTFYPFICLGFS